MPTTNLSTSLKHLEKDFQIKPKGSRRGRIIEIRTEISEIENRKPTETKFGDAAPRGDKHSVAMSPPNHNLPSQQHA